MKPRDFEPLRQWLDRERWASESEAESALANLFDSMPLARPSSGFAARVLANATRLGLVPPRESRLARHGRWFSATLLVVVGFFGVVIGAQLRQPILARLAETSWTDFSVALVALIGRLFAIVGAIWQGLAQSSETLSLNLQTPGTALTLIVALSLSTLAFRVLRELLSQDRSSLHVQSH